MVIVELEIKEKQLDKVMGIISNYNKLNDDKIKVLKAYKVINMKKDTKSVEKNDY